MTSPAHTDDRLERLRLKRVEWARKDGDARDLEELRKVVLAELFNHFEGAVEARKMQAYAHQKYRDHVKRMVQMRTEANVLWADVLSMERDFERWRTKEATRRAEIGLR